MATTMSAVCSSAMLSPLHRPSSSLILSRTSRLRHVRWSIASVRAAISSSTSSSSAAAVEFDISFGAAPSKEKSLDTERSSSISPAPLLIPWIVRGEDGKLMLSSTPPPQFIREMAEAKTSSPKKDNRKNELTSRKKAIVTSAPADSAPPKFSKAARRFYNQNFREVQRLNKALAAAGVASRRKCDELIFDGKVTINGSVCKTPQTQVDLIRDSIYVNGNRLPKKMPPKLYFAVNKPKGYICSNGVETRSVVSLFDDYWKSWTQKNPGVPKPRLFTVGRLDVATTGLIIVTNDGDFAQKLSHPSSNISKEYIATIEGAIHKKHLITISEGTKIDGIQCTPDSVELMPVQPGSDRPRLRIVVHEGRHHEVRELVKNAGLQLHSLKRVRVGGYRLPSGLGYGKYAELLQADLNALGWKSLMGK